MPLVPPPLSPDLTARLRELYESAPRTRVSLRELVNQHLRRTNSIAAHDPFVDAEKARKVARSCLALLDAWQTLPPPRRGWVKAACLYFAERDDEDDDFESDSGFDDDAEIVNHVAMLVGLSRLSIPRR